MREEFKTFHLILKLQSSWTKPSIFTSITRVISPRYRDGMLEHMDKEDNHDFPLLIKIARGEQVKNAHQVIRKFS